MPKLTKSFVDKTPTPDKKPDGKPTQTIYRDEALPGFGLLVGSGGTKSFFVEKRVNGKVKRISIGRYGHITPTQARTKALELLSDISLGHDPAAKKKASLAKGLTLKQAYDDYLKTRKNLKPGTIKTYRILFDGCIADWYSKRMVDISKDMIEARHQQIGETAPARANNVMRTLRAVFNHAMTKYEDSEGSPLIAVNPVDRLSQSRGWYEVKKRKGHLKPHELKPWFEATQQLPSETVKDYLHLVLFTGLRRTEAASMRWDQVSFEDDTFTVPDTKNKEPHTLPFSQYIKSLLQRRHSAKDSEWVFPSPLNDSYLKDPRGSMEYVHEHFGRTITLHDLRRTFITIAESLDIPAYALKKLINHRDPNDVTAGYIVSGVDRLRVPMQKVADFILAQIGETND